MPKVLKSSNNDGSYSYLIICTACKRSHAFDDKIWTFNDDYEFPTFTPSMLSRHQKSDDSEKVVCHSFVTDGKIQYLSDCTHKFAGQTLDLEDI